jgi:hypothetical protein
LENFSSFGFAKRWLMSGKTKCAKMCGWLFSRLFVVALSSVRVACNDLRLKKVGDFKAQTFF